MLGLELDNVVAVRSATQERRVIAIRLDDIRGNHHAITAPKIEVRAVVGEFEHLQLVIAD